jgi:hypothetical protein
VEESSALLGVSILFAFLGEFLADLFVNLLLKALTKVALSPPRLIARSLIAVHGPPVAEPNLEVRANFSGFKFDITTRESIAKSLLLVV